MNMVVPAIVANQVWKMWSVIEFQIQTMTEL